MVEPVNSSRSSFSDPVHQSEEKEIEEKEIQERIARKPQKSVNQETVETLFFKSLAKDHKSSQFYTLNETHNITFSTAYDKIYIETTGVKTIGTHILSNSNHNLEAVVQKTREYISSEKFQWAIADNRYLKETLGKAFLNLNKDIEEWNKSAGYLNFLKNTFQAFFSKIKVIIGSLFGFAPKYQVVWLKKKRNYIQKISEKSPKDVTKEPISLLKQGLSVLFEKIPNKEIGPQMLVNIKKFTIEEGIVDQFQKDMNRNNVFSIQDGENFIEARIFSKEEQDEWNPKEKASIQKDRLEEALGEENEYWNIPLQKVLNQTISNTLFDGLIMSFNIAAADQNLETPFTIGLNKNPICFHVNLVKNPSGEINSAIISLDTSLNLSKQVENNKILLKEDFIKGSLQFELTLDKDNEPQIEILKREYAYTIDGEIFKADKAEEEIPELLNPKILEAELLNKKQLIKAIKETAKKISLQAPLKQVTQILQKYFEEINEDQIRTGVVHVFKQDITRETFFSLNEKNKKTINSIRNENPEDLVNENINLIKEALGKENDEWSLPLQTMLSQNFITQLWSPLQLIHISKDLENGLFDPSFLEMLIKATIHRDETGDITSIILSHASIQALKNPSSNEILIDNAIKGLLEAELTLDKEKSPHIKILKREYTIDGETFTEEAS